MTEYDVMDDKHPEAMQDDLAHGRITEADVDAAVRAAGGFNQQARMMMVSLDPLLRKLPYEQRTALLLNLLVTYAAEEPAAQAKRGKFINAMVEEFRKRLQMYLPLSM